VIRKKRLEELKVMLGSTTEAGETDKALAQHFPNYSLFIDIIFFLFLLYFSVHFVLLVGCFLLIICVKCL